MLVTAARNALRMPRIMKRLIALSVDTFLCVATVSLSLLLRLDEVGVPIGSQWFAYIGAVLIALPLFVSFGFYRAIFRYAGWGVLIAMIRACSIYTLIYGFVFTVVGVSGVPRTIGILQPILLFITISSSRAIARYWLAGEYNLLVRMHQRRRVLIYGAGAAGRQLAAGLATSVDMQVIGFVDDDEAWHGKLLNGKPVYPGTAVASLIDRLQISDLLLAIPSASRQQRNKIIEDVRGTSANIRTLPGLADLAHGRVTVTDLRELDVGDLLGRDAVPPDSALLSIPVRGKVVLVTGAGGSIGSELCRQAIALQPTTLLLLDSSEFNLYSVHRELQLRSQVSGHGAVDLVPLLASIQDRSRIDAILAAWKPNTIYHAAAYKHVPLVEHNVTEGVRNNAFGTLVLAQSAHRYEVERFVLVSTDKAVRPTNVMGATKRLAELILQALSAEESSTCFSIVRFGNVLDSSGSVVPLFRQQIRAGGPVTVTHPDVTRYFMTIPEAAQLVIQASAMAHGGEVFVLDMGQPVRIMDLARRMIESSGLFVRSESEPDGDIDITIVGLRPGEKLYEELLIGNNPEPTLHPRILKANEHFISSASLMRHLEDLSKMLDLNHIHEVRNKLQGLVIDYQAAADNADFILQRNQQQFMQPALNVVS